MIEAIIFDLDGTLIDSMDDIIEVFNCVLREQGLGKISADELRAFVGTPLERIFHTILPDDKKGMSNECARMYRELYLENCTKNVRLYPNVKDGIERLEGKMLSVATTKHTKQAVKILTHLGIADRFDIIIGSDKVSKPKPDPEMLLRIIDELGVENCTTLMIGDSESDILAGRCAGTRTCLVTYGYGDKEKTLKLRPDFVVNDFIEILGIIKHPSPRSTL